MNSTASRRQLRFCKLPEIMAEVDRLAASRTNSIGNWSFPQILDHLAKAVEMSIDGYGFRAPWYARTLIAPLVKNSLLTKSMQPGFQLPATAAALIPAPADDVPAAVERLRAAFARYQREPQRAPHPFLGQLAEQEYDLLHLRHAELHLSFVIPDETV